MAHPLLLQGQPPCHQYIPAGDDHETARDHAAVGEHDGDSDGKERFETIQPV